MVEGGTAQGHAAGMPKPCCNASPGVLDAIDLELRVVLGSANHIPQATFPRLTLLPRQKVQTLGKGLGSSKRV